MTATKTTNHVISHETNYVFCGKTREVIGHISLYVTSYPLYSKKMYVF